MKKRTIIILCISIVVLLIVAGFVYVTRPVAAPSNLTEEGQFSQTRGQEVFRVNQDETVVTFTIDEILRGEPFTVVGSTDQLTGEIAVTDIGVTFGTFKVNGRTFKTDNQQRDGAIVRMILRAEQLESEFITFVPTVVGNNVPLVDGETVVMQLMGDLTIAGVTNDQVFDVVLTRNGDVLTGTAQTTLNRSDYGLVIPNIPFVAGVPDTFTVELQVTAEKK